MKARIYIDGQKDISEILEQHPDSRQIVGQLPPYFYKRIPSDPVKKLEAIHEIYDAFDKAAFLIRDFYPDEYTPINDMMKKRPQEAVDVIHNVLVKHKIMSKFDDFDIEYIDKGGKGAVYKLQGLKDFNDHINDDEYVIKVYHVIKGEDWQPFKSHGCYAETNSAAYWTDKEGWDTDRGKFYFASLKSGYLVEKFLDEDVPYPKRKSYPYKYGIKCTDEAESSGDYNRLGIKGYHYDFGGLRVINRVKNGDTIARQYFEKVEAAPLEKRDEMWFHYFYHGKGDVHKRAGLALAIKFLDRKAYKIYQCMNLDEPLVNRALAYVLKYLPQKEALQYFEKLIQTKDVTTQIILLNEIPLLAMVPDSDEIIDDLIPNNIDSNVVYKYYKLAEKHCMHNSVEHLGSYVHFLPPNVLLSQYKKLVDLNNSDLHYRLIYKHHLLEDKYKDITADMLAKSLTDPFLIKRFKVSVSNLNENARTKIEEILDNKLPPSDD